jgi:hypothetical protein
MDSVSGLNHTSCLLLLISIYKTMDNYLSNEMIDELICRVQDDDDSLPIKYDLASAMLNYYFPVSEGFSVALDLNFMLFYDDTAMIYVHRFQGEIRGFVDHLTFGFSIDPDMSATDHLRPYIDDHKDSVVHWVRGRMIFFFKSYIVFYAREGMKTFVDDYCTPYRVEAPDMLYYKLHLRRDAGAIHEIFRFLARMDVSYNLDFQHQSQDEKENRDSKEDGDSKEGDDSKEDGDSKECDDSKE